MASFRSKCAALFFGFLAAPAVSFGANPITQWNFTGAVTAPDNSPAPTTGTGTATMLGMTNSYTYSGGGTGAVATGDVLSSPSAAVPAFSEFTWRIRGTTPNNGWNLSAPQYTQGAEFDVSTVGFQNIVVGFDWFSTNQGVRDLQEQYTTDGQTWNNINSLLVAVPNDFNQSSTISGTTMTPNKIDLSSIPGANNNANFGIRLVSAYDPTYSGTGAPTYTSATIANGQYNNSSGNWRFNNITFSGDVFAAPEPGVTALLLCNGVGLLLRRRTRRA